MGLLNAIQDEQFRADVGGGLRDVLNRGLLGGLLGMPVDLATMAMRPLGYKTENPVGGSEWIGQKMQDAGLVSAKRNPVGEALAGLVDPATMAAGAIKAVPMAAGMFIGKGAKTWDALQASKAMELEKAGTPARQIWSETGTWKGPDGMWRQEIPDNAMSIENLSTLNARDKASVAMRRQQLLDEVKAQGGKPTSMQKFQMNQINNENISGSFRGTISDALKHDDLYAAYPNQASTKFNWMEMPAGTKGEYSPESGIALNMGIFGKDAESFAAHEMQHAIQQREGFAKGGSPEGVRTMADEALAKFKNLGGFGSATKGPEWLAARNDAVTLNEAFGNPQAQFDMYKRLAGEAEARATQTRIPMDAAQRRAAFPEDSYDVPMNALILRGLLAP